MLANTRRCRVCLKLKPRSYWGFLQEEASMLVICHYHILFFFQHEWFYFQEEIFKILMFLLIKMIKYVTMIKRNSDAVLEMNCAINILKKQELCSILLNSGENEGKKSINHEIKKINIKKNRPGLFLLMFQQIMLFIILKNFFLMALRTFVPLISLITLI